MNRRLQEIKRKVMTFNQELREIDLEEHVDWLLEQAEKVEQLQQENERLKKFLNWEQEEAQGLDEEVTFQLEQLKQAQAKIERYEKALEFYADEENYKENLISEAEQIDGIWVEPAHYEPPIIYFDKGQIARQALEGKE